MKKYLPISPLNQTQIPESPSRELSCPTSIVCMIHPPVPELRFHVHLQFIETWSRDALMHA